MNWILLVGGITPALTRTALPPLAIRTMANGICGVTIIWWEANRMVGARARHGRNRSHLRRPDGDLMAGDPMASSIGGAVGTALALWSARRARAGR